MGIDLPEVGLRFEINLTIIIKRPSVSLLKVSPHG
jgi:hypothetical protein